MLLTLLSSFFLAKIPTEFSTGLQVTIISFCTANGESWLSCAGTCSGRHGWKETFSQFHLSQFTRSIHTGTLYFSCGQVVCLWKRRDVPCAGTLRKTEANQPEDTT